MSSYSTSVADKHDSLATKRYSLERNRPFEMLWGHSQENEQDSDILDMRETLAVTINGILSLERFYINFIFSSLMQTDTRLT